MTAENFAYWLQGFLEISRAEELTKEQVQEIKNHLRLVFNKVTPDYDVQWCSKGEIHGINASKVNPSLYFGTHASC